MARAKLKTLEATAYHEAGHAVAALQLRVGIGRRGVSLVPNEDWSGFVHTLKGFSGRPDIERTGQMRLGAENRTLVLFAGEAAQRRFRPMSVRRHHAAYDRRHAIDLMNYFVGSTRELEAYLEWLHIRAESFVASPFNWKRIETVAAVLMARKHLTAGEVKEICIEELKRAMGPLMPPF
jgi:hypothetical protein